MAKKTQPVRSGPTDYLQPRLYDVTFTFDPAAVPEEVSSVGLVGEFLFYRSQLKGATDEVMLTGGPKFPPSGYEPGMSSIGGRYFQRMAKDEKTGLFKATLRLPAGAYPYGFLVNPRLTKPAEGRAAFTNVICEDGKPKGTGGAQMLVDPKNPPLAPTPDGAQRQSVRYVGSVEECLWVPAADPAVKGTLTYMSYRDIRGDQRSLGVYLPAGYDKTQKYPLILVSHGGGGNECDWFHQGSLAHLMDNLVSSHKTEPAVVVTMNNTVYGWDFAEIDQNLVQCILPLLERVFSLDTRRERTAFCGLSMGGITTMYTYMHLPERIGYFGAFSGGFAGGAGFTLDAPILRDTKLLIGCGEEDMAYNPRPIGVPPIMQALKDAGLEYTPYFVPGSHDWFVWPAMFAHWAREFLWK